MGTRIDEDFLISELWRFYKENGKYPRMVDFRSDNNYPSSSTYNKRFGSWNNALIKAGMPIKANVRKGKEKDLIYQEILKDYNNGLTLNSIAKKYGYSNGAPIAGIINKLQPDNKRNNQWKKEQIEILKENYSHSDWDTLLSLLAPFKKEDIITKAYKLNLKKLDYYWSDDDEKFLKENYGTLSMDQIMQKINTKTYEAILTRANKLGLVSKEKWSKEDLEKLSGIYPYVDNGELTKYFPNRSKNAIISTARDILNIKKDESLLKNKKEKTKQILIDKLIEFAKELQRTPTTDEINENENMGGAMSYVRYFGSYNEACRIAGLEPNVQIFGKHYNYLSKLGDVCLSLPELDITNILIDNAIDYQKEVLYRDVIEDDDCGLRRMDWLINNDLVVEFFGMMDKKNYAKRAFEKINLCKDNGISIISLYPEDLSYNFRGLIDKFKMYNIDLKIKVAI